MEGNLDIRVQQITICPFYSMNGSVTFPTLLFIHFNTCMGYAGYDIELSVVKLRYVYIQIFLKLKSHPLILFRQVKDIDEYISLHC